MLVAAAEMAGMEVPEDTDGYDRTKYPHWHVFCVCQLGRRILNAGDHWGNAKVIADIPLADLKTMTFNQIKERGFLC